MICDNVIVRTLANISKCSVGLILLKYCIQSISINTNDIKLRMRKHFVDDCVEHGRVTFYWVHTAIPTPAIPTPVIPTPVLAVHFSKIHALQHFIYKQSTNQ